MSTMTVMHLQPVTGERQSYVENVNARCEASDIHKVARFCAAGVTIPTAPRNEYFIPWHLVIGVEAVQVRSGTLHDRITGFRGSE